MSEAASMPAKLPPIGRVVVIVPTYNEAENIRPITERLRKALPDVDLLIADDNSPDGTGAIADELAHADQRVNVLHRPGKQGLGVAYVAGFRWALEKGYDVIVEMDADGSHQPEELHRILTAVQENDLVLGSRWVKGGKILNWPLSRKLLSQGGNFYIRVALGVPIRDATAGFRAYRREVLETIDLDSVASHGYCFQVDLLWRTYCAGFSVAEVPITFPDREHGQSNMSTAIVREALWKVTTWGAAARWKQLRGKPVRAKR